MYEIVLGILDIVLQIAFGVFLFWVIQLLIKLFKTIIEAVHDAWNLERRKLSGEFAFDEAFRKALNGDLSALAEGSNYWWKKRARHGKFKEAINSGQCSLVQKFLNAGVNVNDHVDLAENTALHVAVEYYTFAQLRGSNDSELEDRSAVVQLLLAKGADPERKNREGETPQKSGERFVNEYEMAHAAQRKKAQEDYEAELHRRKFGTPHPEWCLCRSCKHHKSRSRDGGLPRPIDRRG